MSVSRLLMMAVQKFKLLDGDLVERFVRTCSGKGGQKVNKSAHGVFLTHLPTGLNVKCQDSRSLELNRVYARNRLTELVEWHLHGDDSRRGREILKVRRRNDRNRRRSCAKLSSSDDGDVSEGNKGVKLSEKLMHHLKDLEK
eukprot:Partr_v1_DN23760_c0_g1_i2_m52821 putative Peptide chain release factor